MNRRIRRITDQLGRTVAVPDDPQHLVALCPSTTETLFELGLGGRVVGRTDHCVHPADRVHALPSVGATKSVRMEKLQAVAPDLVISVREENDREQVEAIAERWPTLVLDPVDVASAIAGVELLGTAFGGTTQDRARTLAGAIAAAFAELPRAPDLATVYLIWRKPFMAVGGDTYVDDVMQRLGLANAAHELEGRYPILDDAWFARAAKNRKLLVMASSEPFPFAEKHLPELRSLAPEARLMLVDGEMFSWHGARMLEAARYFQELVDELSRAQELTS